MTKEQQYFLHLVKSHLNNTKPEPPENIDFEGLFKVCELQDMTAIAAIELKKLPAEHRLSKEDFSPFNQVLGLTLQNYEYKQEGIRLLTDTLTENGIKHLFIKGAAIRELYPVPEVRTSGDTDVIVDSADLERTATLLAGCGFKDVHSTDVEHDLKYRGEDYEIKCEIRAINADIKAYFADILHSDMCENSGGSAYKMQPLCHLVYITSHLLRHFKSGGAGVRQLADMDVIMRNCKIDFTEYLAICKSLGIEKSSKVLLSLCKEFFATPIDFEYEIEPELLEILHKVMLEGGTFGYGIGDVGTTHLMHSEGSTAKAVLGLFAVNKERLYHDYKYAREHRILLPVAYVSRLYSAVFKRGRQNAQHIRSMFTDREVATELSAMLEELEIK